MNTVSKWSVLVKLIHRSNKHLSLFIISVPLAILSVLGTLLTPLYVGRAIDCIIGMGAVDFGQIKIYCLKIIISSATAALAQWLLGICSNKLTYKIVHDLRDEAFLHIQELPLSYLDSHSTGDIVSRMITDVEQISNGLLLSLTSFLTGVATIIGALFFMLSVNPLVALIVIIVTPMSLIAASLITKHTYKMFRTQSQIRGDLTSLIDELISGQKVVQAFGYEAEAEKHFDEMNSEMSKFTLKAVFYSSLTNPSTRFINALAYAGIGACGAIVAISGGISIGGLTSLLAYANQYTKPFNEITDVLAELQNALACAGRIFDLIEVPKQTADPIEVCDSKATVGQIDFKSVSFSYSPDRPLIDDFNLTVKPGQLVAIVGPTGCGKTTLINLLMRFYEPNEGKICIDGVDISTMSRHELRKKFGMVLQETRLKTGTIRDNICMGRPDASDEDILAAAVASHSHEFIKRLPNGYDTVIDESGGNLSQGQKQLLCIARVMLTHPPMLILDEATSSIDTRTELKVQDAFSVLMNGRTTFIVAHRLSTIREADIILVMRNGKIIEKGTHNELLEKQGFYCELYNSQFAQ